MDSTIIIRGAELSDLPYLYEICLKTGDSGKDASALFSDPYVLGQYYAAPYLFFERDLCFVAEMDGVPQGYILGVSDSTRFETWLDAEWLPPLRQRLARCPAEKLQSTEERGIVSLIMKQRDLSAPSDPLLEPYPAHLHIDLLPSLQGKGQGRTLMNALFSALSNKGVKGVSLGVSGTNTSAIGFYKKLGFSVLQEQEWGLVMGKEI